MKPLCINENGIALVLILWVLALLSVIAGEFSYAMRTEVNITRNFREQSQAYYIALAGLNEAIGQLIRNQVLPEKTELFKDETGKKEHEGEIESGEGEEETARWRINTDIPPVIFGAGRFKVNIGNEAGKTNINQANEAVLKMMMDAFDLEPLQKDIIVDSILDWRDKNDLHRLNGAEKDYYHSLPEPYDCKNDYFDSVEELLLVKGVTPEIYYGGLKDMVTVFLDKRTISKSSGDVFKGLSGGGSSNRININAASERMLLALPLMTNELVQDIIAYRKKKNFKTGSDVASVVGADVYQAISPYISFEENPYYTISSAGLIPGSRAQMRIDVMVEINPTLKRGWRIVQWRDGFKGDVKPPSTEE